VATATSPAQTIAVDEQEVVDLVTQLVNIPSVTGSERAAAEFLVGHMQGLGLDAYLQEVEDGRPNAIGILRGSGGGPALAFNGHLDTATSGQPDLDYPGLGELGPGHYPRAYVKDGQLYGLGAFNMKGGVGAAVTAVGAIARSGIRLAGDLIVAAVVGESENAPVEGLHQAFRGPRYRGGGIGTRYYITHGPVPDLAVVVEPSGLVVTNCEAGYLFVKVVLKTGGGSHGEHLGPRSGAINALARVVDAIEDWIPGYTERHRFNTGLGPMEPFAEVGAVESGWPFKPTYKPPIAHLYVSLRLTPAMRATTPLEELRALLDGLKAQVDGLDYVLHTYASNFPSTLTHADHPLVESALQAEEAVLGRRQGPSPARHFGLWNDSITFRLHGIPAIRFGPSFESGAGQQYDRGQHVSLAHLGAAANMYTRIALDMCNRERTSIPGNNDA
jgi:acetylornithine deacetylase/succinyl-diaminopimelate desuccinylase-like protein